MDHIRPDSLMAAGTSYFSAVEVFGRSNEPHFFFVLEDNKITGTLHYANLFNLPARLCIFALTLELEQLGLKLCQANPEESWNLLSSTRRSKVKSNYLKKRPKSKRQTLPYGYLLEQTMFVDKGTILSKSKLLTKKTRQLTKRTFSKADGIRNACAHTGGESRFPSMLGRNRLPEFIKECNDLIALMRQALINNG